MKKEIHVWDLPIKKVYIQLRSPFREEFFNKAYKKFNNWKLLGEYLNIKRGDTRIARDWKQGRCCYPLDIILKISRLINTSEYEIEKNIVQIKAKKMLNKRGGSSGKPLDNPKFPIKINADFAEILGHISGDGTISRWNPKKGIKTAYTNSEINLVNKFDRLISDVFGEIKSSLQTRTKGNYRRPNYQIVYPTIISYIILAIYDYKTTNEGQELPKAIFNLNKDAQCRFLRALFDDEGYVNLKRKVIRIGMKPKKCIEQTQKILQNVNIPTTDIIKEKKEGGYFYSIRLSNSEGVIKFHKKIGFEHPMKKEKLNKLICKGWKFKRFSNGMAKIKIKELLKNNENITINQISKILKRTPSTIREHIEVMNN